MGSATRELLTTVMAAITALASASASMASA
jgi:hypothetical protein